MEEHPNDIAQELALLHTLSGAEYSRKVEQIARRSEFHPIEGEKEIFTAIGEHTKDYLNLIRAAKKAVGHGTGSTCCLTRKESVPLMNDACRQGLREEVHPEIQ